MRRRHGPAARLYAIVPAHTPPERLPAGIHVLGYRELSAAVSDELLGRGGPARPDLVLYRAVVGALFAQGSVVPVQPGVVFRRVDTLVGWLELHYAALTDAMSYVEGRGEARLHVCRRTTRVEARWHADDTRQAQEGLHVLALEMFHQLGEHVVAWTLAPTAPAAAPPRVGREAAVAAGPRSEAAGDAAHGASGGSDHGTRDASDISASFLVERSRWREFADTVAAEKRRMPGLEIALSGPWPPYDFVRLEFGG